MNFYSEIKKLYGLKNTEKILSILNLILFNIKIKRSK